MELSMADKVKRSIPVVLLIVLCIGAVILSYNIGKSQNGEKEDIRVSSISEKSNPIDTYFQEWEENLTGGSAAGDEFASAYLESWRNEMLHAYELLLEQVHPDSKEAGEYVIRSKDSFLDFSRSNAWIEAAIDYSNEFGKVPLGEYAEELFVGNGFGSGMCYNQIEQYRFQTFYLYDLLESLSVEPEFVFDADALSELRYP